MMSGLFDDEGFSGMVAQLIRSIEAEQFKTDVPDFGPGDTVRVHVRVVEGNRERIQVFEGVVIRRRAGGINENVTVRRIAAHGIGVERTFLIHSPRIAKFELTRSGRVRRARLYYLRGLTGRAARIKERRRPLAPVITVPVAEVAALPVEETFDDIVAAAGVELAPEVTSAIETIEVEAAPEVVAVEIVEVAEPEPAVVVVVEAEAPVEELSIVDEITAAVSDDSDSSVIDEIVDAIEEATGTDGEEKPQ